jgi:hypothetical protein
MDPYNHFNTQNSSNYPNNYQNHVCARSKFRDPNIHQELQADLSTYGQSLECFRIEDDLYRPNYVICVLYCILNYSHRNNYVICVFLL